MQTLHVLGLDHTIATVSARESFTFSKQEIAEVLPSLLGGPDSVTEAMVLCTCNRTEVYLVNQGTLNGYPLLPLRLLRPNAPILEDGLRLYTHSGLPAVEQLFGVASSLRSQMPGDTQISRQLASSIQLSRSAGSSGPYLNRAVDWALRCAKRVRASTGLAAGGDSLGAEVLRLLRHRFSQPASVVISGTGALAGEILALLSRFCASNTTNVRLRLQGVWSSDFARGQSCGESFGITALSNDEFSAALQVVDALVIAGAGPHPLLRPEILAERRSPLYVLDLGLPRNMDPGEYRPAMAYIRDLDSVQQAAAESRINRRRSMEQARAIVENEARRFFDKTTSAIAPPLRAESYQAVERLVRQLRLAAPAESARLRVGMHRLLAAFFDGQEASHHGRA